MKYIIALDQSTQGTKGLLLDEGGSPVCRVAKSHEQIVLPNGYVEHRPEEIYQNVLWAVRELIKKSGVAAEDLLGVGISNQRETALAWHRKTGVSFGNAVERRSASESPPRDTKRRCVKRPGSGFRPTSPRPRSLGSWKIEKTPRRRPGRETSCAAPWTVI